MRNCVKTAPSNDSPLLSCNRFQSLHKNCFWIKYIQKLTSVESVPVLSKLKTKRLCFGDTTTQRVAEFQMVTIGCHKMYILIFQNPQMSFSTKFLLFLCFQGNHRKCYFSTQSLSVLQPSRRKIPPETIFFSFVWKSGRWEGKMQSWVEYVDVGCLTLHCQAETTFSWPKRRIYGRGKKLKNTKPLFFPLWRGKWEIYSERFFTRPIGVFEHARLLALNVSWSRN